MQKRVSAVDAFDISRFSLLEQTQWHKALASFEAARQTAASHIVVFGEGSFGDVLQVSPLLHHLRKKFPGALISFVHPAGITEGMLRGNPDVDHVLILRGALHREARRRLLTQAWSDLVVHCSYVIRYAMPSVRLSRLSAQQRNWVLHAQVEQEKWLPLVQNFPFDNDILWRKVTAEGLNLFSLMARTAGFADADFELFHMALQDSDFARVENLPERYVTVCNSAEKLPVTEGLWTKTMPAAKMARIVSRLKAEGVLIVLLGAKDDASIDGVEVDLRGKTSLNEAAAVIKAALCHIGPEGGLANLARAVNTPSIIFFGATPAAFFGLRGNINVLPRACGGCWWTVPYYLHQCPRLLREPECTASLSEDEIIEAFQSFAASRQAARRRLNDVAGELLVCNTEGSGLMALSVQQRQDFAARVAQAVSRGSRSIALVMADSSLLSAWSQIMNDAVSQETALSIFICDNKEKSPEAVRNGKNTGSRYNEGFAGSAEFIACLPQNLPARDSSFDAVFCPVPPIDMRTASFLMQECARILAHDGELLIYCPVAIEDGNVRNAYAGTSAPSETDAVPVPLLSSLRKAVLPSVHSSRFALLRTHIKRHETAAQGVDA